MTSAPLFGSVTSEISINTAQNSSFYIKSFSLHLHAHRDSDQELAHSMQARSSLLPVFINKNILEHSHSCLFHHSVPTSIVVCSQASIWERKKQKYHYLVYFCRKKTIAFSEVSGDFLSCPIDQC